MYRLSYCSRQVGAISLDEAKKIAITAADTNRKHGLSGVLVYNQKYFLQCIEGSKEMVNEIYHKITKDARHKDLCLLHLDTTADERYFEKWGMGFAAYTKENRETFFRYSEKDDFDPYALTGQASIAFLREISKREEG